MIADAIITSISANIATIVATSLDVALSNTDLLDVPDISPCNHEKADTRLFLHVQHARSKVIIKTVDTDAVIIAIFCLKIWELNGYGLSLAVGKELALYQYTKLFHQCLIVTL